MSIFYKEHYKQSIIFRIIFLIMMVLVTILFMDLLVHLYKVFHHGNDPDKLVVVTTGLSIFAVMAIPVPKYVV